MFFHLFLKSILKSKTAFVSVCFLGFVAWVLPVSAASQKIMVFGDSLSAAYGIPQNQGWVVLLQNKLHQENLPYEVINASISGETTSGGLTRIDKALKLTQPQIVILELGANDGLRGLPVKTTRDNLAGMLQKIKASGAKILLIGMKMPPNYGAKYTAEFSAIYPQLAKSHKVGLVPFMLDHVAAKPDLIQLDGLHPNALGQPIILDNIWPELKRLLKK